MTSAGYLEMRILHKRLKILDYKWDGLGDMLVDHHCPVELPEVEFTMREISDIDSVIDTLLTTATAVYRFAVCELTQVTAINGDSRDDNRSDVHMGDSHRDARRDGRRDDIAIGPVGPIHALKADISSLLPSDRPSSLADCLLCRRLNAIAAGSL